MTEAIDVSLLPAPEAIKPLSYADIKAARLASLRGRYQAAGIPWDVDALETDPGVILQEEDAFRELLDKGAINDGVRAVLPAFAKGADLEHLTAFANVGRQTVTPADPVAGTAAVREGDTSLLLRYLDAFSAPAASSEAAYRFRTRSAAPELLDISVLNGGDGKVLIYLLGVAGVPVPLETVLKVALALQGEDAKGLTDDVSVRAATVRPYDLSLRLQVPRGPAPSLVADQAEAAVRAFALARYRIAAEMPANALVAAAYVPNVLRVIATPEPQDIPAERGVAPWLRTLSIAVEVAE